ncbi:hypothetical protein ZIOFF_029904 [Zingiber officinale]|uniref:Uncharacterized protein n=1 Tax=Zingiber officinale TaxID=94328 RepID=A0A8J5LAY7_ZINOF|nr:hypothetical protein ZIOFF_029904 [Zingiber officinale]
MAPRPHNSVTEWKGLSQTDKCLLATNSGDEDGSITLNQDECVMRTRRVGDLHAYFLIEDGLLEDNRVDNHHTLFSSSSVFPHKAGQIAVLDAQRNEVLENAAKIIQNCFRTFVSHREFVVTRVAAIAVQAYCRGTLHKFFFYKMHSSKCLNRQALVQRSNDFAKQSGSPLGKELAHHQKPNTLVEKNSIVQRDDDSMCPKIIENAKVLIAIENPMNTHHPVPTVPKLVSQVNEQPTVEIGVGVASHQAANESGALREAKSKLEKKLEDLMWRLALEKKLRVALWGCGAADEGCLVEDTLNHICTTSQPSHSPYLL